MKTKSKYRSTKTKVADIMFSSKKEALRYGELVDQIANLSIFDLEIQPKFILIPKFASERAMAYVADFMYLDEIKKTWIIEDVKGFKTKDYRIKKKIFLYQRFNPTLYKFGLYKLLSTDFDHLSYLDDTIKQFRFKEIT